MITGRLFLKHSLVLFLVAVFVLVSGNSHGVKEGRKDAKKKWWEGWGKDKTEKGQVMNEGELQSQLMDFADRYASVLSNAFEIYSVNSSSPENRRNVLISVATSISSAFLIAAETDPDVGILDMVVMVTLGRMIYEEHWLKKLGSEVEPILEGLITSEKDVWQILGNVLSTDQQQELINIIKEWRRNHPEMLIFSYIRFAEFAADRRSSKLSRGNKVGGIFKSVEAATQQVEEIRLMSERSIYLGSRLFLMTGIFLDAWVSRLTTIPDIDKTLNDLHRLSEVVERLANVSEALPDHIAAERETAVRQVIKEADIFSKMTLNRVMKHVSNEREAAIKQLMEGFDTERKKIIQDFIAEETRLSGILVTLRETLTEGNNLIVSANALAERLDSNTFQENSREGSEPFDINNIRQTVAEVTVTTKQLNSLVESIDRVLNSAGLEKLLPHLISTIEQVGDEAEDLVDKTFRQAVILILILLAGYLVVKLILHYVSRKPVPTNPQKA